MFQSSPFHTSFILSQQQSEDNGFLYPLSNKDFDSVGLLMPNLNDTSHSPSADSATSPTSLGSGDEFEENTAYGQKLHTSVTPLLAAKGVAVDDDHEEWMQPGDDDEDVEEVLGGSGGIGMIEQQKKQQQCSISEWAAIHAAASAATNAAILPPLPPLPVVVNNNTSSSLPPVMEQEEEEEEEKYASDPTPVMVTAVRRRGNTRNNNRKSILPPRITKISKKFEELHQRIANDCVDQNKPLPEILELLKALAKLKHQWIQCKSLEEVHPILINEQAKLLFISSNSKACRRCNEVGHLAKFCDLPKPKNYKENSTCSHCRVAGHKVSYCPHLKKNPKKNSKNNKKKRNHNKAVEEEEEEEEDDGEEEDQQASYDRLLAMIQQLEMEKQELNTQVKDYAIRIVQKDNLLKEKDEEIHELKAANEELKVENQDLRSQVTQERKKVDEIEKKVSQLEKNIEIKDAELAKLLEEIETARKVNEDRTKEYEEDILNLKEAMNAIEDKNGKEMKELKAANKLSKNLLEAQKVELSRLDGSFNLIGRLRAEKRGAAIQATKKMKKK